MKNQISTDSMDLLTTMSGCEVLSKKYGGCVEVSGNQIVMNGDIIDILDTNKKINHIWNVYFRQEMGGNNIQFFFYRQ